VSTLTTTESVADEWIGLAWCFFLTPFLLCGHLEHVALLTQTWGQNGREDKNEEC
jgi:hypothetical protein